jgi:hypothetical protein
LTKSNLERDREQGTGKGEQGREGKRQKAKGKRQKAKVNILSLPPELLTPKFEKIPPNIPTI